MTLEISLESSEPNTMCLILDGKLDTITAPELDQFISHNLNRQIETLVLDLQKLSFVSSAGLRIFAKTRKIMKSRDGKIWFVNLSPQVQKVFDIVKAVPVSEVFQDPKELDAYLATLQNKAVE
ncbi:STAS domain-containing protein [Merismopedia glauca]|uniref:Anti-sigma factor antagonist n=1 Tax=Merismopedia glauca CCAP 1448/3 TaxID=1296344 RepID=A0A2T1BWX5_9CYAN|nr:STAS domain-containing protein [Merismopedia glauca]PSB00458.1 anti-sigma factor antagonist [Merismopedia glauca CCAP 1448/3]